MDSTLDRIAKVNGPMLRHMDMIFTEEQEEKGEDLSQSIKPWPKDADGSIVSIPYEMACLDDKVKGAIEKAFAYIQTKTCVRFVKRENQDDYIRVVAGTGCYSYVGRVGGAQDLSLGKGCEDQAVALVQLMHTLGFLPEHTRPDRDLYLRINFANVKKGYESEFKIMKF